MPDVSVVTVFYNRADYVAQSVRSLLDQTHPDLEIVVVDDGSTDGTWAEIDKFEDPRLRKVRGQNQGFTRAVDAAVRSARGRLIAIHGSGDVSLPDRLLRQAEVIDRTGADIVTCWVRTPRGIYKPSGLETSDPVRLWPAVIAKNPFSHGEVMYRKERFLEVGGYRPFFQLAQDRDLWLRMGPDATYAVATEVLYDRFQQPGSVRSMPDKVVKQRRYSAFAAECARLRLRDGGDPVDRGMASADVLEPRRDLHLAREFLHLAGSAVKRRDFSAAGLFFKAARESMFAAARP